MTPSALATRPSLVYGNLRGLPPGGGASRACRGADRGQVLVEVAEAVW
jgi:hypothetical protein